MKTHHLLIIGLCALGLTACTPRITRNPEALNQAAAANSQQISDASAVMTANQSQSAQLQTAPSSTVVLGSPSSSAVVAPVASSTAIPASTPSIVPATSASHSSVVSSSSASLGYTENPATFTHSNTLPTGIAPKIDDYANYDDYLAAYYDHYGRNALNPPVPAFFSNQSATTTAMASTQTIPSSLPAAVASSTSSSAYTNMPAYNTAAVTPTGSVSTATPLSTPASTPRVIEVGSSEYQSIMQQASQALQRANAAAAQAQQASAAYNSGSTAVPSASVSVAQSGSFAGAWQGDAVDDGKGIHTTTRFVLEQRGDRLGGQVYFETLSGLEYFGELQGALVGNESTMTLRYQDGSYTYFTGQFGASFFTGEYQYITSGGQSIASGTLRLSRQ